MTVKRVKWQLDTLIDQVKSVCLLDEAGCWVWNYNPHVEYRYPVIKIGKKTNRVSRWLLFAQTGRWDTVARHKCDNPPCCNPNHLEWGSHRDNVHDMIKRGRNRWSNPNPRRGDASIFRRKPELFRGERHGISKLTDETVRGIRQEYAAGASPSELAQKHGVHKTTILNAALRHTWKHVD